MTQQEIEYIKLGLGNCAVMSLDLNNKAQHALNRLDKLEEVCREIVENPTQMVVGAEQGDDCDYDYGYTEGAKYTGFLIAQKLKAVLEEA